MKIQVSIGFLTMLFIVLKLTHTIDWSWWWLVFIFLFPLLFILFWTLLLFLFAFVVLFISGRTGFQDVFEVHILAFFRKLLKNNARK